MTIAIYSGGDPEINMAVLKLEEFIGDVENFELTDGTTVYVEDAVAALNVLIARLSRSEK